VTQNVAVLNPLGCTHPASAITLVEDLLGLQEGLALREMVALCTIPGWGTWRRPLRFQDLRTCRAWRNFPRLGRRAAGSHLSQGRRKDRGSCQGLSLGTRTQKGGKSLLSSLERRNPAARPAACGGAKTSTSLASKLPRGYESWGEQMESLPQVLNFHWVSRAPQVRSQGGGGPWHSKSPRVWQNSSSSLSQSQYFPLCKVIVKISNNS
jgi:hypothetical protein